MNLSFKTHVGPNGVLHIEGLDQVADQDVTVTVSFPADPASPAEFDLEQYTASTVGPDVAASIMAISDACSSLPVLDDRSADEILGYNAIGLPE
ncbi:MAG: type II toxin-antitoxin system VapB family antitoxin [Leptolyngbya sp. SIO4C1]|nr:type II toxin-antitoxin system VapB family antitoxin [Leptolyngbya sp. SIO4C1]